LSTAKGLFLQEFIFGTSSIVWWCPASRTDATAILLLPRVNHDFCNKAARHPGSHSRNGGHVRRPLAIARRSRDALAEATVRPGGAGKIAAGVSISYRCLRTVASLITLTAAPSTPRRYAAMARSPIGPPQYCRELYSLRILRFLPRQRCLGAGHYAK
jgi:hypothetical protein